MDERAMRPICHSGWKWFWGAWR